MRERKTAGRQARTQTHTLTHTHTHTHTYTHTARSGGRQGWPRAARGGDRARRPRIRVPLTLPAYLSRNIPRILAGRVLGRRQSPDRARTPSLSPSLGSGFRVQPRRSSRRDGTVRRGPAAANPHAPPRNVGREEPSTPSSPHTHAPHTPAPPPTTPPPGRTDLAARSTLTSRGGYATACWLYSYAFKVRTCDRPVWFRISCSLPSKTRIWSTRQHQKSCSAHKSSWKSMDRM